MATGIQIDGNWVGMVQAELVRGSVVIDRCVQKSLSGEYDIPRFFSEQKIPDGKFIISLPRQLATVKFIALPSTKRAEIQEMVRFETGTLVPFSPEELLIDFRIVKELENGYSRVMAIVVEKAVVEKYLSQLGGFTPLRVSLSSLALSDWFIRTQEERRNKPCVLVNADFSSGDIIMLEDGSPNFTRGIAVSEEGWIEKLVAEITRSIDAYTQTEKGAVPEAITVTGARENLDKLANLVEQTLSIPTDVANAFTGTNVDSSQIGRNYPGLSSVIPVGLASEEGAESSSVNLLPGPIQKKREAAERVRSHVRTAILTAVLVLLATIGGIHALGKRNSYLHLLIRENKAMEPLVSEIDSKRKQLEIIKKELDPGSGCLEILGELHRITPQNIVLSTLAIDVGQALTLAGQAEELSGVWTLNNLLEESALFKNVKVKYANKRRVSQTREVTDFEIDCLIGG